MEIVKLHVRTEPYYKPGAFGHTALEGNKVIGEVKRGSEVLHTQEVITDDTIESVCDAKESIALRIELWAVENTDFTPTADAMPS